MAFFFLDLSVVLYVCGFVAALQKLFTFAENRDLWCDVVGWGVCVCVSMSGFSFSFSFHACAVNFTS